LRLTDDGWMLGWGAMLVLAPLSPERPDYDFGTPLSVPALLDPDHRHDQLARSAARVPLRNTASAHKRLMPLGTPHRRRWLRALHGPLMENAFGKAFAPECRSHGVTGLMMSASASTI
jgi:hypothetical protein